MLFAKDKFDLKVIALKSITHLLALGWIVYFYYLAFNDQLGADPVKEIIHFTGMGALNLLIITLVISPISKYFKQAWLIKIRRLLGLYGFFYALCHLANFIVFELQFDWSLFLSEVFKRPYITLGMVAFLLLFSLAITSISRIKRKMGKKWQSLHNYSYAIILLVSIHFYWSVKSDVIEPSIYILATLFLLNLRRERIKRWLLK